jgi:excisionase family DNA binding protein
VSKHKSLQRLESVQGAAGVAGVHPKTIRRWISDGRITGYRMGPRLIKVDLDELADMLTPIGGAV